MLHAITFDFWGTLYQHAHAREERAQLLAEALVAHNQPRSRTELEAAENHTWSVWERVWREERRSITFERWMEELLTHLILVPDAGTLVIHAGKRFFKLTYGNLAQYMGERGRRGKKLPRGFQNVDWLESQAPVQVPLELGDNMDGQGTEGSRTR